MINRGPSLRHNLSRMADQILSTKRNRRSRESGSQVLEATLVIVPLLLMTFLMLDLSMVIFLRTTMQEAVREGTRYAITGQNTTGPCQDDSIKTVVKAHAAGYLGSI